MYFLLNMRIFHCYVSLPEGSESSDHHRRGLVAVWKKDSVNASWHWCFGSLSGEKDSSQCLPTSRKDSTRPLQQMLLIKEILIITTQDL